MEIIQGQTIIEVPAPQLCLIDETKFRLPLNEAIVLRNYLTEEINKEQEPFISALKWDRNKEQKEAR